jgi:SAM-dependent methyltransferase
VSELNRWHKAQEYERSYWAKAAARIVAQQSEQLGWYSWRAAELEKQLAPFLHEEQRKKCRVLEVGSGPVGIISALKWGDRYAVDPLEGFYRENATLTQFRDTDVHYLEGAGEQLPFEDKSFLVVILDNVIDHTSAPDRVLREIYRVLSPGGRLYLAVNVHITWGALLHAVLAKLQIDRGHPYSFTPASVRNMIRNSGFVIQAESVDDYYQARNQDRNSSSLSGVIKGYTGLSEFVYRSICLKGDQG